MTLRERIASLLRRRQTEALFALLAVAAVALWLPALQTPFWGDDYVFLEAAARARVAWEPVWKPYWPDVRYQFWRPLGHESYWRFVEGVLDSDPVGAHAVNLLLGLAACSAVGLLGLAVARAAAWERPLAVGGLASGIYAVLALHFTPLHWPSSGDSLMISTFTALALAAWLTVPLVAGARRMILCVAIPALQALALFSKESAAMIPMLMLCATAFIGPGSRPGRAQWVAWGGCIALIAGWLAVRPHFVTPPPEQYALVLEGNLLRNAASLAAWLLNLPREGLRLLMLGDPASAVPWLLAAGVPMAAFVAMAGTPAWRRLSMHSIAALLAFVLLGYAPYLLLAWQSYEYYAEVSAMLPVVMIARGLTLCARPALAVALLLVSSAVSIEGSRTIGYPGLIARANQGEARLRSLILGDAVEGAIADPGGGMNVMVSNHHAFYGVGTAGIAWRLGRPSEEVSVVGGCGAGMGSVIHVEISPARPVECPVDPDTGSPAGTGEGSP